MSCSALEVTDARRATEGPGNWMCEIFDNLAFQLCDGYYIIGRLVGYTTSRYRVLVIQIVQQLT